MENKPVVYKITNLINNKKYVGSAKSFIKRKKDHLNRLKNNKHHSKKLQNSFNKYGEDAFEFNILEVVEDINLLIQTEQKWIDELKPEYNMTLIAGLNSHLGMKRSNETKKKISDALTGRKLSDEHKEKVRQTLTGKKFSEERKEKHKKALNESTKFKEMLKSKERNEKIKQTRLKNGGYIVTYETKKLISETLKKQNLQSAISVEIEKYSLDGGFIESYPSMLKAENDNNIGRGCLYYNLVKNKKEEYKGFIWKFKN
jgi:group I intron endonuclease